MSLAKFNQIFGQIETSGDLPRSPRGKAKKTLEMEQAILDIVEERNPITVRGVCYALFTRGLISGMYTGETQKVSRVMTDMREKNDLDWTLIVDGSRAVETVNMWRDPSRIISVAVMQYRRDAWQDQLTRVEVWSEKSTVQGVLSPVLQELGVTFRVMKGFGSYTSVRQAAEDSHDTVEGKDCHVLYLGDWDPSGLYMSEIDLPSRLERYGSDWQFRRIALTLDDLDGLPSFPTASKTTDRRCDWYAKNTGADPRKCWELDAMNPNDLRDRVRDAIEEFIDHDAWDHALKIERAEKESMQDFHERWKRQLKRKRGGK